MKHQFRRSLIMIKENIIRKNNITDSLHAENNSDRLKEKHRKGKDPR
jgi:hypothetical protein